MKKFKKSLIALTTLSAMGYANSAIAAECYLDWLGNARNGSESYWLAFVDTRAPYDLVSSSVVRDSWNNKYVAFLRSNDVNPGNGGVHRVFNSGVTTGKGLCSQQQKDPGIDWDFRPGILPPNIDWPRPIDPEYGNRPPIGHPIAPDIDPEYGNRPPIAHPIAPDIDPEYGNRPPIGHPIAPDIDPEYGKPAPPEGPVDPEYGVLPFDPETEQRKRQKERRNQGASEKVLCPDNPAELARYVLDEGYKHCFEDTQSGYQALPAISEGRTFDSGKLWNIWADARLTNREDERFSGTVDSQSGVFAVGVDKRIDRDWVLGAFVNVEDVDVDGPLGLVGFDSSGFNLGPYLGYRLSEVWSMDVSVSFGWYDNKLLIQGLSDSRYDSEKITTLLNFTGDYMIEDEVRIKPKFGINYSVTEADGYSIAGAFDTAGFKTKSGDLNFSAEFSKRYLDAKGLATEPMLEIGAKYRVENWSGGEIDEPWSGELRAGLRRQIDAETFIKIDAGYSSIGNSDIDEWDIGGFISWQF